jgi:ADP-ribose pyrophosphatase YjhB (NUDIX family)
MDNAELRRATTKAHANSSLLIRLLTLGALFQRPMTLGVRGIVVDAQNRILLVRHTYVGGFFLPGGGVGCGETFAQALARELVEEGNITIEGPPTLHGVYLNRRVSRRDHVALYVVRHFSQSAPYTSNYEIAESKFFALDDLPPDTTPATLARLDEVFNGAPISPYW